MGQSTWGVQFLNLNREDNSLSEVKSQRV